MEMKQSHASQREFSKHIIRCDDVPIVELAPGIKTHIISAEKITLSIISAEANAQLPPHRHENEQMMIVLDGGCDFIIEGKPYTVQKGDVVVLPSNIEHGGRITQNGCSIIDVFSPPRQDFIAKLEEVKKSLK